MMPDIRHHLDGATLMSFSAGTLGEALAAVAAAHIAMCPACREELRDLDLLGGTLLDGLGGPGRTGGERPSPQLYASIVPFPVPTSGGAGSESRTAQLASDGLASDGVGIVAQRLGVDLDVVAWRWLAPGIKHCQLPLSAGTHGDLRLLMIAPGMRMPEHGHGGTELTLVLEGCYRDETGEYHRGDIQDIDGDCEHQPIADAVTGCVCLIASEQPARFKGLVPRLLQPFTGF